MSKWKKIRNNEILEFDGYYISYNPQTGGGHKVLTDIANIIGSFTGEEFKDGEETALYDYKHWRILEGDFRKDYEECKTLKDCIKVYNKNKKYKSSWSTK